jgi:tetratricopeptide (TPR) repeat protein
MNQTRQTSQDVLERAQKLWNAGKAKEAHTLCQQHLRKDGSYGPLLHFFAGVLDRQGNTASALKHLEFACKAQNPKNLYFLDLAKLLRAQNMSMEAQNVLTVAMKRDPNDVEIKTELASLLILNGFFDQGVKLFNHVIAQNPTDWESWAIYASSVASSPKPKQADQLYEQAMRAVREARVKKPDGTVRAPTPADVADILMKRSDHLKTMGDPEGCEKAIRDAIATSKYFARAWSELATLSKFTDADFKTVEKMLRVEKSKLSIRDIQHLHYALGEAYMRKGNGKIAMQHYLTANRYQRDNLNYNEKHTLGYLRGLPNYFTADVITNNTLIEEAPDAQQFIFIVGVPRCGSSLLERVLDSHSDVVGVGEIRTMPALQKRAYGQHFPSLPQHASLLADKNRLAAFAKAYREEVARKLPPEATEDGKKPRYVVDKMLGNFVSVGLIAMAFPNSKIIHSRRDPIDTAFSCFTHFFGDGHSYLCDLAEIGRFYLVYQDLMNYWEQTISDDQYLTVDYERVVADLKGEALRLLNFLGLEWQDACLEFHGTKREVRTHSALEVRKPIYNTSVERWRPYEQELAPLFDALGIKPN